MKARYVGLCRGCGAYTRPRNGKGDAIGTETLPSRSSEVLGRLADHECPHGRLPFDSTPACGCWPQEGAAVLALPACRKARRDRKRAA